jgi:hypothetical protein
MNSSGAGSKDDEKRKELQKVTREFEARTNQIIQGLETRLARVEATGKATAPNPDLPFEVQIRRGIPEKSTLEKFLTSVPLLSVLVAIATLVAGAVNQYRLQKLSLEHASSLQRESRVGQRQLEAYQKLWKLLDTIETNYSTGRPSERGDESIFGAGPAIRGETLDSIRAFKGEEMFFLLPLLRETLTLIEEIVEKGAASRSALNTLIQKEREVLQGQLITS